MSIPFLSPIPAISNVHLLVSARSIAECEMVLACGAKWLDVKEPSRGSLGRPDVELIRQVVGMDIPAGVNVSFAGGELREWTDSLHRDLAAILPDRYYLKLALAECGHSPWLEKAKRISESLFRPGQLILVHYADATEADSPSWDEVLEASDRLGCQYVLVDTHNKKSGGLLDHCSIEQLQSMMHQAKKLSLSVALAGSLQLTQVDVLSQLGAEWLGFRGALCQATDRTGCLCPQRLEQALTLVSHFSRNAS